MDSLNVYCFRRIFHYLLVEDKLSFSRVNSRCKDLIKGNWNDTYFRNYFLYLDGADESVKRLHIKDVLDLVELVGSHMKSIQLEFCPKERYHDYCNNVMFNMWITLDQQNFMIEKKEEETHPWNRIYEEICVKAKKVYFLQLFISDFDLDYSYIMSSLNELKSLEIISENFDDLDFIEEVYTKEEVTLSMSNFGSIPATVDNLTLLNVYLDSEILIPTLERLKKLDLTLDNLEILNSVFNSAKQLRILKITGIYDELIKSDLSELLSLEELALSEIGKDETFHHIVKSCTNVHRFTLEYSDISENALAIALKMFMNLKYLRLNHFENINILVIPHKMIYLHTLIVNSSDEILGSFIKSISKMPVLTILCIKCKLLTANLATKILDMFALKCKNLIFNHYSIKSTQMYDIESFQLKFGLKRKHTIANLKSIPKIHLFNVKDFSNVLDYARNTLCRHIISKQKEERNIACSHHKIA